MASEGPPADTLTPSPDWLVDVTLPTCRLVAKFQTTCIPSGQEIRSGKCVSAQFLQCGSDFAHEGWCCDWLLELLPVSDPFLSVVLFDFGTSVFHDATRHDFISLEQL